MLTGSLSNGYTQASVEFEVSFIEQDKPYYFIEEDISPSFVVNIEYELSSWIVVPGKTSFYQLPELSDPDQTQVTLGHRSDSGLG